ncbi:probable cysteine--tRNA ligase [Prionailurus iriomotensis]
MPPPGSRRGPGGPGCWGPGAGRTVRRKVLRWKAFSIAVDQLSMIMHTLAMLGSYVRFDIIRRILTRVFGCNIIMVMGITDVDDKIIKRAGEMNVSPASLANLYEENFKQDMAALKRLVFGSRLDIHSGGMDLAFPHHENEIAQCEAFHQCRQWGNYFLHSGHLHVKGKEEKMSKSLKNYITVKADFLKTFSPDVFRLFCMRSSYRSAVDYSDGTMLEAKHLLLAAAAFIEDARAYMKGQLVCGPVGEGLLWERLRHTREAVKAALADDFDTPAAVDAVMDLIHRGNGQLQARTKEPSGPRSPAVFGSIVSYIEHFFETVGISLADRQCDDSQATLHSVVEELVRFRLKVRQFALASGKATGEAQRQQRLDRQPLLEACDTLRQDLTAHGISIKSPLG